MYKGVSAFAHGITSSLWHLGGRMSGRMGAGQRQRQALLMLLLIMLMMVQARRDPVLPVIVRGSLQQLAGRTVRPQMRRQAVVRVVVPIGVVTAVTVVVVIVRTRTVVVVLRLSRLPLRILLVFHASILKPNLDLPFGQIQVSC